MNATFPPSSDGGKSPRTRDFEPADQPAVRQLIQDGLRQRWGPSFDPSCNPDLDNLWTNYVAPGGQIVVTESNDDIIATGILCLEPTPPFVAALTDEQIIPRLRRISVSQNHQRQGLGRLIVEELVSRAFALGFRSVLVSTDTPWTDAVALYQSCGFATVNIDAEETHLLRRAAGR